MNEPDNVELINLEAEAAIFDAEQAPPQPSETGGQVEGEDRARVETVHLIAPLVSFIFDIGFPAWRLKEGEKALLAKAYADVLDKYFPNFEFGVEVNALILTAAIIGPRISTPSKERQEPRSQESEGQESEEESSGGNEPPPSHEQNGKKFTTKASKN